MPVGAPGQALAQKERSLIEALCSLDIYSNPISIRKTGIICTIGIVVARKWPRVFISWERERGKERKRKRERKKKNFARFEIFHSTIYSLYDSSYLIHGYSARYLEICLWCDIDSLLFFISLFFRSFVPHRSRSEGAHQCWDGNCSYELFSWRPQGIHDSSSGKMNEADEEKMEMEQQHKGG